MDAKIFKTNPESFLLERRFSVESGSLPLKQGVRANLSANKSGEVCLGLLLVSGGLVVAEEEVSFRPFHEDDVKLLQVGEKAEKTGDLFRLLTVCSSLTEAILTIILSDLENQFRIALEESDRSEKVGFLVMIGGVDMVCWENKERFQKFFE
jgi:hypothetical protein